jgi:hypothetical protein
MEDHLISKILKKILIPIVGVLFIVSMIYGWWINDYDKAFKQMYLSPVQYVTQLIIKPRLNRLENRIERISTTTPQQIK